MCQMNIFVKEGSKEELLKENITKLEILEKSVRVSSLFEAPTDLDDMILKQIDFTAGKVFLEKR